MPIIALCHLSLLPPFFLLALLFFAIFLVLVSSPHFLLSCMSYLNLFGCFCFILSFSLQPYNHKVTYLSYSAFLLFLVLISCNLVVCSCSFEIRQRRTSPTTHTPCLVLLPTYSTFMQYLRHLFIYIPHPAGTRRFLILQH